MVHETIMRFDVLCKKSLLITLIACLPSTTWSQQNLFNVPSIEITEKNRFFFQQQFNFGTQAGNSNTTIDYGLGNNLEVGINLFNLDLYPTNNSMQNPHFLVNFQKAFDITENYKISFGTQTGITPPLYHSQILIPSFTYLNNAVDLEKWGTYYLGLYYANQAYVGSGSNIGLMVGVHIPIFKDKFHVMADIITGSNDNSVAVVGGVYHFSSTWNISLGAQLPDPRSHNDYGMVFEITRR